MHKQSSEPVNVLISTSRPAHYFLVSSRRTGAVTVSCLNSSIRRRLTRSGTQVVKYTLLYISFGELEINNAHKTCGISCGILTVLTPLEGHYIPKIMILGKFSTKVHFCRNSTKVQYIHFFSRVQKYKYKVLQFFPEYKSTVQMYCTVLYCTYS